MKKILFFLCLIPIIGFAQSAPNQTSDGNGNINNGSGSASVLNVNNTGANAGQSAQTTTISQIQPTTSTVKYISAPSMGAPMLTATHGNDICLGSVSGAISGMGFGVAGGKTVIDENCVLLKNTQRLNAMGLGQSATIMFITKSDNILESIFLGDPKVYLDIVTQQVAVLQSKIAVSQAEGKNTSTLESALEEASFNLKVAQHRIGELSK